MGGPGGGSLQQNNGGGELVGVTGVMFDLVDPRGPLPGLSCQHGLLGHRFDPGGGGETKPELNGIPQTRC